MSRQPKIVLLLTLILSVLSQKVMYFHDGDAEHPKQMDFSDMRNKPQYLPMDCSVKDCKKFVKTQYPALFYWKGPGSAFQRIQPPTHEKARQHLMAKQLGFVNRFRRFLEQITLFETFLYSIFVAWFLYIVFSYLFTPPHLRKQKHRKHQKKQ